SPRPKASCAPGSISVSAGSRASRNNKRSGLFSAHSRASGNPGVAAESRFCKMSQQQTFRDRAVAERGPRTLVSELNGGGAVGAREALSSCDVLFNKNRVEQVAESISQLIHTLAAGRAQHGPTGPERFLRSVAPLLSEDTIIGQRVVKLLVAMTGKAKFF